MIQNLTGQKIGNYDLRDRLGRGGMAEVYRAWQPGMERFVAIKVMLSHLSEDEQFIERFRREAKAVGSLRHQHIVQVFDFGHDEERGIYYMVMEHITGGNLKALITREGKMSPDHP
ncbi:MAG: protein kinase [Chloroflexota bacterium]